VLLAGARPEETACAVVVERAAAGGQTEAIDSFSLRAGFTADVS
jgi:hypothetical protein